MKKITIAALSTVVLVGGAAALSSSPATTPAPASKAAAPLSAGGPLTTSSNDQFPPVGDVSLTKCVRDPYGWVNVGVEVVNHSPETSNYTVEVEFLDSEGVRVDQSMTFASDLAPGQKYSQKMTGSWDDKGKVTCKLLRVERFASIK